MRRGMERGRLARSRWPSRPATGRARRSPTADEDVRAPSLRSETRKRLEAVKAYVERGTTPYLDRHLPMPRAKTFDTFEIPATLAFYVIAIAVAARMLDRDWLLQPAVADFFLFAGVY